MGTRCSLIVFLAVLGMHPVLAEGVHRYWAGFSGAVQRVDVPLTPSVAQDRFVTLNIRLVQDPKAKDPAYDAAFHAACKRHVAALRKTARALRPASDWRVKVVFSWPHETHGSAQVTFRRHQYRWLSNCRVAA